MAWIWLTLAILLEVAGTTAMKFSDGFTNLVPTLLVAVFYTSSFSLLILVMKTLDLSLAYAVWAGVGTALVATIGILWFKEPVTALKMISIGLIIIGVVGLHLSNGRA
ncbi:multidrug efflux SMR transporter [Magnetospira sp. QH-2]|uniref:DMT family transporter n=1 Tax=Magnetospira sp. (strain QH-2) TaxID=1288970 RepID=UPI0003E80C28|nr:multidrug efflux SMR transporter [Magnetospira sp. QH-2]CCQ74453.1 putative metabolite-efflux transporter yvaE [Magnetospira sp. QH-2]